MRETAPLTRARTTSRSRPMSNTISGSWSIFRPDLLSIRNGGRGLNNWCGQDFAFRPTAGRAQNLNNWGVIDDTEGSATVVRLQGRAEVRLPRASPRRHQHLGYTPFSANQRHLYGDVDATPSEGATGRFMALSSGPKTAFGDFACLVRFQTLGIIDARKRRHLRGPRHRHPVLGQLSNTHSGSCQCPPARTYSFT